MKSRLRFPAVVACALAAAPAAPAVELAPGDLVAVDARGAEVPACSPCLIRIDPVTGARQAIASVPDAFSVAIDSQGQLLVAGYRRVTRVDPATGASQVLSQGGLLQDGFAITLDAEGRILAAGGTLTGSVVRVDPETGAQTLLATGGDIECPTGLGLLPDGDILVIDAGRGGAGPGEVLRVDAQTGEQARIASPTLAQVPWAGVATPEGEAFYTSLTGGSGAGQLVRVGVETGEQAILAAPGDSFALAREAAGTLVFSTIVFPSGDAVIQRIDPVSGGQHLLARYDGFLTGLAVVPDRPIEPASEGAGPDPDHDGFADSADNCLGRWNPTQSDADRDGFGNLCDGDFDGDGRVGARDWAMIGRAFGARQGGPRYDPAIDLNDDGAVGAADFLVWLRSFAGPPGPSGLACAGTPPCP